MLMHRHLIALSVTAAMLLGGSGCSHFVVTELPKPAPPMTVSDVSCTTSRVAPTVDTVGAVLSTVTALGFVVAALSFDGPEHESWESGLMWIGAGLFSFPALGYWTGVAEGIQRTGRCRWWHAERERWSSAENTPAAGTEGNVCVPVAGGWACNPGLRCHNRTCVRAGAAGGPCRVTNVPGAAGTLCDGTFSCIADTCVQAGSRGNPCRAVVSGVQAGPVCDGQLTCLEGRCVQYTKMPAE